jgi:hypothetical protein
MESAKPSSPQQLVQTQGAFLSNLEKAVLTFRERLRNIFEKVLNAVQDHEQHILNLTRRLHLEDYNDDEEEDDGRDWVDGEEKF